MQLLRSATLLAGLVGVMLLLAGCAPGPVTYDETTDSFVGKIVQNGNPVTLPEGAKLQVSHHGTGDSFGIPLQTDGSFKIGWMPTGKYSARLETAKTGSGRGAGGMSVYSLPDGFTIEDGKAEYEIELGAGWKP